MGTTITPPPPYPQPRGLLTGKTVLVTAAAGTGIGFATAKRCAEEGARVFVSDFHERRPAEAVAKLSEVSKDPVGSKLCDVTKEAEVKALVEAAIAAMGHVDVVVNNAGLGGSAPIVDMTDDQWNRVLDVTLTSVFRMSRAILPHMYARKSGVIVNNASVLGWRAQELQAHYAAAKAGVMAFTRCAAIEAGEHGVRVNAVAPSIAMHEFLNKVTSSELLAELSKREACGRPAAVGAIAHVNVLQAPGRSSDMTGEVVSVSSQRA